MTKETISVRVKMYGNDYRETLVYKNGLIPEFPHHIDSCNVHKNDVNKLNKFLNWV